ncbi:HDIG domain-containing protein [Desulfonema limicola]|uniref:HDIG domain-containing protein n=1 Tax=Desulfonema limicola TaxID=45656 RepID=A0A975GI63_9BACT|nr:HDIG domain-containing metalloprotein [Desulfonema limicola]QTA82212.1 HDIG domain-containing protein [Desulfonema limicola]
MKIPTKEECYQFIHEMKTLDHIAAHSFQVCRVALAVTDLLKDSPAGVRVLLNRELVMASAMLHDITKTRSLKTRERHAETGAKYLHEKGFPEVADIVRQHVSLDNFSETSPVNEIEIVNYADKRVLHDKIATLEDRMNYIMERYGTSPEYIQRLHRIWEIAIAQENKIFKNISFPPDLLVQYLVPGQAASEFNAYKKWVLYNSSINAQ